MNAAVPLSFSDAAAHIGMGRRAFYSWSKRNDFPFTIIKVGAFQRIPWAQVEHFRLFGFVPDHDELRAFVREQEASVS